MFETLEQTLMLSGMFAQIGFALGVLYNVFRFIRLSFPKLKITAFVLDFLFMTVYGFTLFVFSVEYGSGFFRMYYVIASILGFTVNMLTLGFAVPPLARLFRRTYLFIARKLSVPFGAICQKSTAFFGKMGEKATKSLKMCKIYLKTHSLMVYNKNNHKIGELHRKSGENRHVIKAKVIKKG